MFTFLMTQAAQARRDARNWLEVADKVYHYRRDELKDAELRELNQRREELRGRVRQKADAAQVRLGIELLEKILHQVGGRVYPKTSLADNVEFFLAAAIIILGIRAFFIQPFKIPTNSMWPSYYGMKHEVYVDQAKAPGRFGQLWNFVTLGATRRTIVAPADGELVIPFFLAEDDRLYVPMRVIPGRKWLVIPTDVQEYTVWVGGEPVTFQAPADFDFNTVVIDGFLGGEFNGRKTVEQLGRDHRLEVMRLGNGQYLGLKTGKRVAAGAVAFSFDVLTGDQLFVDRFTYHFFPPKVGEGFVFRTGNIRGIGRDQYYIKRLVGVPGDRLEIKEPVLYRNGQPITGAKAFELNAQRSGQYRGYCNNSKLGTDNEGLLAKGESLTVGDHEFFALGDNSYNSRDGRYWGFVPEADVMGRPLFIYYPFTRRWGPSR